MLLFCIYQGSGLPQVNECGSEKREHQPIRDSNVIPEPQGAHFLEAHVIFEPLLSAIGVITQQVCMIDFYLDFTIVRN